MRTQVVQQLFFRQKNLVGEGYFVENGFGRNAGDGLFPCRIDGQHDQGIKSAERIGKIGCEVPGTGIKVRLEDACDLPAGEDVAQGADGGPYFVGVVGIVIDISEAGGIDADVEAAPDSLESGQGFADLDGCRSVQQSRS